jgi:hypothetical protein
MDPEGTPAEEEELVRGVSAPAYHQTHASNSMHRTPSRIQHYEDLKHRVI